MAFWLALLLYIVAVVGGILYVVLRGLALKRSSSARAGRSAPRRHAISVATAQIQVHLDRMNSSVGRLGETSRRLSVSRLRLDVQLQAFARHARRCAGSLVHARASEPPSSARGTASTVRGVRVAAVDLGTNTTRLLVADVEHGLLDQVVRRETITRLGESVDRRRILLPTAIARVRNVLVDYRREAEALGAERVLAVGTSAVRDADNGEAFLGEVEWSYGFTTRLLDGGEEAELMLRGVAVRPVAGRSDARDRHRRRVDRARDDRCDRLEWAVEHGGRERPAHRAVLHGDPPSEAELAACAAHVESLLPRLDVRRAIGVAGTVTTAAAVEVGGDDGAPATPDARVRRGVLERLASLPLDERERVPGLEPARAPVIVAGLVVLQDDPRPLRARPSRGERARSARRGGARGRGAARARGRPGTADAFTCC